MDNCTAHTEPEIGEVCAAHGVIICPLPPHSSNQIQPLEMWTFDITKRRIACVHRMENSSSADDRRIRNGTFRRNVFSF
jgi:hypothetical protein